MTKSEAVLWKHLKGKQLEVKFRRQYGVGKYIVDFYAPQIKLVIEIDGLTHETEEIYEKDIIKQKYLEDLGLAVKRYSSQDIFYRLNQVLEDIYQTCIVLSETPP